MSGPSHASTGSDEVRPKPSSFVEQPHVEEDDPLSGLQESSQLVGEPALPTEPCENVQSQASELKHSDTSKVRSSRARRMWKRALIRIVGEKAVEKVNARILNFGTNELLDGDKKYKGNLDELLDMKVQKKERFRSADGEVRKYTSKKPFLLYPKNHFKQYWRAFMTIVLVYVAVFMPYRLAFMEDVYFDGWTSFDLTLSGIFLIDVFVNFSTCYTLPDGTVVDNRWRIAARYLKSWFFIDFVSSIPFNLIDLAITQNQDNSGNYNNFTRLARLPRLYRLFRLARVFKAFGHYRHTAYFEKLQDCMQLNSRLIKLAKFLTMVCFCVHFMGCLWFYSAKLSDFEPDTWVVRCGFIDSGAEMQYVASVYWAVTTTVTVGYGDIAARTETEMMLAIMWMFIGVGFYSFTVGSLSSFLTSIDTRDSILSSKMMAVQEFAKETYISPEVRAKVRDAVRYYTWKMGSVWSDKHSLFNDIPRTLQYEVALSMHGGIIKDLQFFQSRGRSFVLHFMPLFKPVKYHNGEYLYKEGEFADEMYFISKGRVNLVLFPREIAYKSYLRGSYVGEIEIVRLIKRIDNAQVFGDSEFLAVSKHDFLNALTEFPVEAKDVQLVAAERYRRHRQSMLETVELLKLKKERGSLQSVSGTERLQSFREYEAPEITLEEIVEMDGRMDETQRTLGSMQGALQAMQQSLSTLTASLQPSPCHP